MFEELYQLLSQLGLGAATRPLCDLLTRLTGEIMTLQHLYHEIHGVLKLHGASSRTDTVISAMADLGLIGFPKVVDESNESTGAAETAPGRSPQRGSALLAGTQNAIIVNRPVPKDIPETARGWLDIDGGIYFDVRQHASGPVRKR
jgi:hypothetical protein